MANIMIIAVLDRRSETGQRRVLRATRHRFRLQFLSEAVLLGLLGGFGGVAVGTLATRVFDTAS